MDNNFKTVWICKDLSTIFKKETTFFILSKHVSTFLCGHTLKIEKICVSPKVSIQPCWVKSDSALSGAIWAQSGPKKLHQTAIPAHGLKKRTVMDSTETTLFIGPKQLFLIYSVFSCKCSTVVHSKFHCLQDCVTELRHEIYNLNIGIHWEQRTALASTVVKKKKARNK